MRLIIPKTEISVIKITLSLSISSYLIDFKPTAPHEIINGQLTNVQPILGFPAAQAPIIPNAITEPTTNFFHIEHNGDNMASEFGR